MHAMLIPSRQGLLLLVTAALLLGGLMFPQIFRHLADLTLGKHLLQVIQHI